MSDIQLYLSDSLLREEVTPVENSEEAAFIKKPKRGTGLWTSTWREDTQDSEWVEWCGDENFGNPSECHWYLLTPHPDVRLYTVDSSVDLRRLLKTYAWETARRSELNRVAGGIYFAWIDFERLAKDYDGLHLTSHGNAVTHLSYPHDMNAWDCESTCWFRWKFTKVETFRSPAKEIEQVTP